MKLTLHIAGPLEFTANGCEAKMRFEMENVGNTPALNVLVGAGVFFDTPGFRLEPLQDHAFITGFIENSKVNTMGHAIFPGERWSSSFGIASGREALDAKMTQTREWISSGPVASLTEDFANRPMIFVIACIDYMLPFSGEHRQTAVVKQIQGYDPTHKTGLVIDVRNGGHPAELLRVRDLFIGGGSYAN